MTAEPMPSDVVAAREEEALPSGWLKSICPRLLTWAHACAALWEAADLYEQLSGLTDAELAKRGLSRATLAYDVRNATDFSA